MLGTFILRQVGMICGLWLERQKREDPRRGEVPSAPTQCELAQDLKLKEVSLSVSHQAFKPTVREEGRLLHLFG